MKIALLYLEAIRDHENCPPLFETIGGLDNWPSLYEAVGGHPLLFQAVCHHLFEVVGGHESVLLY